MEATEQALLIPQIDKRKIQYETAMLNEVKTEVSSYSQKLSQTIDEIKEGAELYEKETARRIIAEVVGDVLVNVQSALTSINEKLDKLVVIGNAEQAFLEDATRRLNEI